MCLHVLVSENVEWFFQVHRFPKANSREKCNVHGKQRKTKIVSMRMKRIFYP